MTDLDDIVLESDPIDVARAKRARRLFRERQDAAYYMLERMGFGGRAQMVRELPADVIDAERVLAAFRDDVQAERRRLAKVTDDSSYDFASATLAALGSLWAALG